MRLEGNCSGWSHQHEQWAAGMPSSAFEKRFDYILKNTRILPINSDPTSPDTDGDGLYDDEEYNLGTNSFTIDTDRDMLDDEEEVSLGTRIL